MGCATDHPASARGHSATGDCSAGSHATKEVASRSPCPTAAVPTLPRRRRAGKDPGGETGPVKTHPNGLAAHSPAIPRPARLLATGGHAVDRLRQLTEKGRGGMATTVFGGMNSGALKPPEGHARGPSVEAGLFAQAGLALSKLREQPDFFRAIVCNKDGDVLDVASSVARSAPHPFIEWLTQANPDSAQAVMWAVRTALEDHPALCSDSRVQEAAVAVYMLCALRWVEGTPDADGSRVVAVPTSGRNVLAVLSAAFFGGRIQFALQARSPQALHVYDVRAPVGEAPSANLLRAIYCALFAEDMSALDVARKDDDDPKVIEEMVQRLRSRLNDIRLRKKLSFTLIIDRADAFQEAPWADSLEVMPFVVDEQLAEAVFLINPHQLDQEINELLRQLRPVGAEVPSDTPAPPSQPTAMSTPPSNTNVNNIFNFTAGSQSPITNSIAQSTMTLPTEEFQAAIQSLKEEIARLQSVRARDKMTADLTVIEDAVVSRPVDAKGRITRAMEAMKNAGEAADGAESVLDKLAKLKELATPILAALF